MTDVVITYVNCEDVVWREQFEATASKCDGDIPRIDGARYRDFGTLPLLVDGVKKYMPWVRNIYIVVSGETQVVKDIEGVTWVFHRDIIPQELLPTFNSTCIELFLWRIEGLAEQFIYFNDDMFPIGRMEEEDFFFRGLPKITATQPNAPRYNLYSYHLTNSRRVAAEALGVEVSGVPVRFGHTATPMLRSTWRFLWEKQAERLWTSCTPFRTSRNINQEAATYVHYLSRKYASSFRRCAYTTTSRVLSGLTIPNSQIVCVNDTRRCYITDGAGEKIRNFIINQQTKSK